MREIHLAYYILCVTVISIRAKSPYVKDEGPSVARGDRLSVT